MTLFNEDDWNPFSLTLLITLLFLKSFFFFPFGTVAEDQITNEQQSAGLNYFTDNAEPLMENAQKWVLKNNLNFFFSLYVLFTWYFACCVYGCTLLFHLLIYFILHFSIFSLIFLFIFYPISFGIYISIYVCRIENLKRPSGYTQRLCGYIWFEFVLVRCSLHGIEEKMLAFRPFSIGCLIRGREREKWKDDDESQYSI